MKIKRILELGYYPVSPYCAKKGAQIVDGQWHMPRWGCDTLQHIIDAWETASQPTNAGGRVNTWICSKCGRELLDSAGEKCQPPRR